MPEGRRIGRISVRVEERLRTPGVDQCRESGEDPLVRLYLRDSLLEGFRWFSTDLVNLVNEQSRDLSLSSEDPSETSLSNTLDTFQ